MNVAFLIKQKEYEKVIFTLRRHPITFVPIIFLFVILMTVPVGVFFLINSLFANIIQNDIFYGFGVLLGSIYYLSVYLFFFAMFVDYYLDIWIVTNDRIVNIEQNGLFSRTISELDLFRIQDVTTEVHGIFPTLFRYGDVHVKTASSNINIIFKNIHNPDKVREALIVMADEDRKFHYHDERQG